MDSFDPTKSMREALAAKHPESNAEKDDSILTLEAAQILEDLLPVNENELPRNMEPEIAYSFQRAVQETLLGDEVRDKESTAYKNLTPYEKTLLEKEDLKINLLIDMDGVLINTEQEIRDIASILTKDMSVVKNAKEAIDKIKKSKIPFGVLKTLLSARKKVDNLILVTDRLGYGPCYFPCLGKEKKDTLKKHGIDIQTDSFKMFSSGEKFLPLIEDSDITYYIGSSGTDDKYVSKVKDAMDKKGVEKDKLWYMKVHIDGKESVL